MASNDALEKTFSQFDDDWDDVEDTDEFDMESFWDADSKPLHWEWENPWMLEPR
jgi:hypothetical protein